MPETTRLLRCALIVSNERQRGIDSIAERFGGIFERHCRRGHKPVERLVVDRFQIVGLFERATVCVRLNFAPYAALRGSLRSHPG